MANKKTILITGATAGIGRHAALSLARQGHKVFATGRRQDALDSLLEEASDLQLEAFRLDVTDPDSIEQAVKRVQDATNGDGVDVLINNAGYGHFGPLEEISDGDLRAQFDTNVFGLMAVTRAFLPAMKSRGAGRIINVSSIGGRFTMPLMGAYNASKYALESLSDALRLELASFGIQVVLVEPGPIRTEFGDSAMKTVQRYQQSNSPYTPILARAQDIQNWTERFAPGPVATTRAIQRAIGARWPRARYVAPFSSLLMITFINAVPTRLADWMIRQLGGLTRRRLLQP